MTGKGGSRRHLTTSNPLMTGIWRSRNTRSGFKLAICLRASLPSAASPAISMPGIDSNPSRRTDTAARAFNYMWKYSYNLKSLYETPDMPQDSADLTPDRKLVDDIVSKSRRAGRTILTEFESKQVLSAYGIPVAQTIVSTDAEAAVKAADKIGYPVVLKLYSETITHKTDVGGVQLNLGSAEAVKRAFGAIQTSVGEKAGAEHFQGVTVQPMIKFKDAYELIIGASLDTQFGPVLLFGTGGQLVEVFQ